MTAKDKLSIDWAAIKLEFINGNATLRNTAKAHGINESTLRGRATIGNWQHERNTIKQNTTLIANEKLQDSRIDLLTKLNEIDLSSAQALRDKANEMMLNISSASELKSLSGVFDSAQKISRLALGASTENNSVTQRMLEPLKDTDFLG